MDENRDYAQVLEERDGDGNLLAVYALQGTVTDAGGTAGQRP